ncbi:MAG: hypothetical protein QW101_07585 [Ignisphaera sp.]
MPEDLDEEETFEFISRRYEYKSSYSEFEDILSRSYFEDPRNIPDDIGFRATRDRYILPEKTEKLPTDIDKQKEIMLQRIFAYRRKIMPVSPTAPIRATLEEDEEEEEEENEKSEYSKEYDAEVEHEPEDTTAHSITDK